MKKRIGWMALVIFSAMCFSVGSACAETSTAMSLVQMLTSQLGVTESQASGGAGALFDMAKGALSESDYGQVAEAVPGIDDLIQSAPAVSESTAKKSDKLSGLTEGLGSITKAVDSANNYAAVNDQFKQLGLDTGMVSQFIPVILSFVESEGGETVMNLLKSVWK